MNTIFKTAIAATALAAATSAPAFAQPAPQAPISISSCALSAPVEAFNEGPLQVIQGGSDIQIGFVNRAAVAATDVRFAVSTGRTVQMIDATGTFAGGTPIVQSFSPATAAYGAENASCAVESVTFADGTTWQR